MRKLAQSYIEFGITALHRDRRIIGAVRESRLASAMRRRAVSRSAPLRVAQVFQCDVLRVVFSLYRTPGWIFSGSTSVSV